MYKIYPHAYEQNARNKQAELEVLIQDGKHNLINITEIWQEETPDWSQRREQVQKEQREHEERMTNGVMCIRMFTSVWIFFLVRMKALFESSWVKKEAERDKSNIQYMVLTVIQRLLGWWKTLVVLSWNR